MDTLTIFQKVLHSLPKGHVSKLHTDVSTLLGYLEDMMSSMRCPLIKTANEKSLEAFLKENTTHHITVGYMALDRLEKFMQQLIVSHQPGYLGLIFIFYAGSPTVVLMLS